MWNIRPKRLVYRKNLKDLSLAKGLTQLRQQDPWELTWEYTWQRRTRRDWELAKATKQDGGNTSRNGSESKEGTKLLTINLKSYHLSLFSFFFQEELHGLYFCSTFSNEANFCQSTIRTPWIVILVFSGTFFWSNLNYIVVLCPCYLTLNLWNQLQNEKHFWEKYYHAYSKTGNYF